MIIHAFITLVLLALISETNSLHYISSWPLPVVHNLNKEVAPNLLQYFRSSPHISVSLRHDGALESLRQVIDLARREEITTDFGASTIRTVKQAEEALKIGASFISSTQYIPEVVQFCAFADLPLLCGISSLNDCRSAIASNLKFYKLHPISSMTSDNLAHIVTTIKMAKSDAVVVAAGGVRINELSKLAKLGFDNVVVGFNLEEKTIEDSSKYLTQVATSWISEVKNFAAPSIGL